MALGKGCPLGGPLNLHQVSRVRHHEVEVHLRSYVLVVSQVEERLPIN